MASQNATPKRSLLTTVFWGAVIVTVAKEATKKGK